mmetsp:Transcript_29423/g.47009  ORF Transcript_29423/g.47009 Transcript_29423/m.47009 type:complete len:444 (-) Transcript_29423:172-1503(-)
MASQVTGVIRSFNATKGFGFLASDQVDRDIYFMKRALTKDVRDCLEDSGFIDLVGHSVACTVNYTTDGKPQASEVILTVMKEDDFLVGNVRSFSEKSGYGFLNCDGYESGVFFKLKFVPEHLQRGNLVGQPAKFNLKVTEDGKCQANTISFKKPMMTAQMFAMMQSQMKGGQMKGGGMGMGNPMAGMQMMQVAPKGAGGKGGGNGQTASGNVVSFNPAKGWGFIQSPSVMGDIYFKAEGGDFSPGAPVSFVLNYTIDGKPQAANVSSAPSSGQHIVGTIKSFFPDKGYGFLTAPGQPADIRFKTESLPADLIGQQDVTGKKLRVTVTVKRDGKMEVATAASANGGAKGMGAKRTVAEIYPQQHLTPVKRQHVSGGSFTCTVRSYNAMKGWGFLQCTELGEDIYFQAKLLPVEYQGLALEGATVYCEVRYTPDGKAQAASLQLV